MRKWLGIVVLILSCASSGVAQTKKRVAVLDFDYAAVQSSVSAVFGTNVDVGKGITDLVLTRLVNSGTYSVIERKALEKVLAEQNFSNSDRSDPSSAAKLARILGVDAIIIGSVTQFGRDDKQTDVSAGALGGVTSRFGIGGASKKESKAVVGITARIVSTDTAEILSVAESKGESTRSGASLIGSGGSSSSQGGAGVDMSSSNFSNTLLGEAINKAVQSLSAQLDQDANKLPTKTVKVDGLVADATDGTLVLNVGAAAGVRVGDHLDVRRVTREVRDPATGKVLRRMSDKIGELVITEVDDSSSVGTFSGSVAPKVGDTVASAP